MKKHLLQPGRSVKQIAVIALVLAGCLCMASRANAGEPVLKKGDRVAIVGDSITEQKIYSRYMELYLLACVPQLDLTVCQFGWSGERAPGFANRMENDLLPWKPTVVTTCYGMNDGSYRPYNDEIGRRYEEGTHRIQTGCKEIGARMIVGGPGPVDTDTWRANDADADQYYNENLGKLSEIAGREAAANGFVFAGLHPLMMDVMQKAKAALGNEYHVCGSDGVHPRANGHLVMAYAFLKAMGLDGEIGTITVDMTGETTAGEGHKVLSAEGGTIKIESSRYPFCFSGGENDPNGTRSILPFLPFNKDLNRYTLVVKNLPAETAEVKWGEASKTFSKADLEAGINLADEFIENPFSEPFRALERIIGTKQRNETQAIKGIITNFRSLQAAYPDDKEVADAIALIRGKLLERGATDAAQARAAVKPVTHTIQITPKEAE